MVDTVAADELAYDSSCGGLGGCAVVDTVAAGELAVDAALVGWRLRCVVDTVAAGGLAVDAALVVGSARTWVQLRGKTGEGENPSLEIKWLRRGGGSDAWWL